jgi:zinc resistance-associated protein
MKTHRYVIALVLAMAFVIGFAGVAGAKKHGTGGGGMGAMSPEKKAAMHKAHADFAAATAGLKKQLFAKESALNAEFYGEMPDDKKIEALTAEINAIHAKLYAEKVKVQKQMAQEGILPGGRHGMMGGGQGMMGGGMGMMGGGMGCPMMSGDGMQHGPDSGPAEETPAGEGDHGGHTPVPQ